MSRLDSLSPDQRAVLQLVLGQGRTYGEIAGLLDLAPGEVADRALAALEALAPEAGRNLSPGRRRALADWLLGQAGDAEADEALAFLQGSAPGRAWTRQLSGALEPLADRPLPSIPAGDEGAGRDEETVDPGDAPGDGADAGREPIPRASKIGGALLLAAIVGLVVVAIVTLTGGDGGGAGSGAAATPATTAPTTGQPSSTAPVPRAQINLRSVDGGPAKAFAVLVTQGNTAGFVIFGDGFAPSGQQLYGVWLVNGNRSLPLGFRPVGRNGRFAANAPVPTNAAQFRDMIITRENVRSGQRTPPHPGQVVVRGSLSS